jgi:hypothetical protein
MSTEEAEEKGRAFRALVTRLSERELVRRLKMAGLMAACDEELARRSHPELIEQGNARLLEMGGVSSTEELMSILREELDKRSAAKSAS